MADVSGILAAGNNLQQQNPLGIVQGYQNLANSVLQNKIQQQQLQTGQQALATTRSNQMAQRLYAVNALPDDQVASQAQRILDDALQGGTIDQNHYAIGQKIIQSGNVGNIRQYATLGLIGTLAGPDAINRVVGMPGTISNGQQIQPGMIGGQLSMNPASPAGGFTPVGSAIRQYPAPEWQPNYNPDTRTTTQQPSPPLVGGAGAPSIPGNGSYPKAAPATGGTPAPTGAPATPAKTGYNQSAPMGTPETVQANIQAYNTDAGKVPNLMDGVRNNSIALQALQMAHTGKGTADWFKLGQVLQSYGVIPDGSSWAKSINSQALAEKMTSDAILNNPAVRSDASLEMAAKANPTTGIPNMVAQDIIRKNIATSRMMIAQVRESPDQTSYLTHVGKFPLDNDRRAFAWDTYTPAEQAEIKTELAKNPTQQKAFAKTLGMASRLFGFQP